MKRGWKERWKKAGEVRAKREKGKEEGRGKEKGNRVEREGR